MPVYKWKADGSAGHLCLNGRFMCIFVYLCVFVYFCVFVCLFKFQKWKADESGHFCLQSHSRAAFKSRLLETRKTKAASS